MKAKYHPKIGQRFGKLTVNGGISFDKFSHRKILCQCDCGTQKSVSIVNLFRGKVTSCGCMVTLRRFRHGEYKSKEYQVIEGARQRCVNPKATGYRNYGGRGIKFDLDIHQLLAEIGRKPGPGYFLDRIDNEGNYEAGNIRWATRSEQRLNTRKKWAAESICEAVGC